jgi:hypothetical protein
MQQREAVGHTPVLYEFSVLESADVDHIDDDTFAGSGI